MEASCYSQTATVLPALFEDVGLSNYDLSDWYSESNSSSMQDGGHSAADSPLTSLCAEAGNAAANAAAAAADKDGYGSLATLTSFLGPMIGATAETGGHTSSSAVVSSTTCSTSNLGLNRLYPSSHPLSMAKHICAICGDRASGKHYGVYSCEGCKGFFKRTVRKDLTYTCREARQCVIDKRQRNRCQYCRYQKCLVMGMKREAVQEERQRLRSDKSEGEPESTSNYAADMPPERILEAELATETNMENIKNEPLDSIESIEGQLTQLIDWGRMIPHFIDLPIDDQALLLHTGWNELILASIAHRSTPSTLYLWAGQTLPESGARSAGMGLIFDRISTELTAKMRELQMDRTELGSLRTIVLYNPDAVGLKSVLQVESCREKVYSCLEEYCKQQHPTEPGRFAKLLLRLPALRSIGIKCLDSVNFIPPVPSMACLVQSLSRHTLNHRHFHHQMSSPF